MSVGWPVVPLGNYLRVKHGFAFRGEYFADRGDHIVLTPGNFHDEGGFKGKSGGEKFYTAEPSSEYVLARDDLVIAMTEQVQGLLGSSALIPRSGVYLHNQRIGLVDIVSDEVDRHFLYYLFNTHQVRDQIQATATGAKVRHTAPSRVESVRVAMPPLPTQRKIASILLAYDDLIENNTRRINVMEEMAQRIHGEWFVDFRYPGHEGVRLVESELGPIPEGWNVVALGSHFKVVLGGTPSRKRPEYWANGTVPWINSGETNEVRVIRPSALITGAALASSSARLMPRRTTVLAITGATLGQVSCLEIETSANQSVVGVIDPQGDDSEWLFLTIKANIGVMVSAASGGAQQHINKGVVEEFPVIVPAPYARARFAAFARPIFDNLATCLFANSALRSARDLLLPRLISGEIDLDDLDIQGPAVA